MNVNGYRLTFHLLLSFLLLFQTATASSQLGCQHDNGGTGQETMADNELAGMPLSHLHHTAMESSASQDQADCSCGFDCTGSCMHACQGLSLTSQFDPTSPPKPVFQSKLTGGLTDSGFTSLPLRPPAIS